MRDRARLVVGFDGARDRREPMSIDPTVRPQELAPLTLRYRDLGRDAVRHLVVEARVTTRRRVRAEGVAVLGHRVGEATRAIRLEIAIATPVQISPRQPAQENSLGMLLVAPPD